MCTCTQASINPSLIECTRDIVQTSGSLAVSSTQDDMTLEMSCVVSWQLHVDIVLCSVHACLSYLQHDLPAPGDNAHVHGSTLWHPISPAACMHASSPLHHSFIPVLHPFGSHSDLISPLNVQVLHRLHASYFQLHSVGSQISSAVSPVIPTILPTLIAILPGIRWCSLVFSGVALC